MTEKDPITLEILAVKLDYLQSDIQGVEKHVVKIEESINANFITKKEFEDYKRLVEERIKPVIGLVYGLVGLILVAVVSVWIAAVVNKGGL